MATTSNITPAHPDDSTVTTTITHPSEDDSKTKEEETLHSTSTSGIEENQGRTGTLSFVQSTHEDNKSDTTVSCTSDIGTEKKNEETTSITEHKEEAGSTSVSSTSSSDKIVKAETTTTVTSSSSFSSADGTHREESKSTGASSTSKNTDKSIVSDDAKKEESTLAAASPGSNTDDNVTKINSDLNKEESTPQLAASGSNKTDVNAFHIGKGTSQHLSDFQRKKAQYFFHANLDIENKEFVTWEDVEFYLLFHVTAADKEGTNSGDLEARLSRAARALWEYIHDQVPLSDGKRETLTLDQSLDTWASLIDYTTQTNQLPPVIQDLVKLGFELYATESPDGKSSSIQPVAFDQLFQKMNLGRPYAIMAYKVLTENGTILLDADKIESIVRAVITSSDDEHASHFLLPGFFKIIGNNPNNKKSSSSVPDNEPSDTTAKSAPSPTPSSASTSADAEPQLSPSESEKSSAHPSVPSQVQQTNDISSSSSQPQQPNTSSSQSRESSQTVQPKQPETPSSSVQSPKITETSPQSPPVNQQVHLQLPQEIIQQEDDNIRRLLRYYRIDDGDLVEVASGSVQRVVLVHPERPLPSYIQQNKELLHKLESGSANVPSASAQQNAADMPTLSKQATTVVSETKPKVTLEQRIARGEAQRGPTVPFRQDSTSLPGARQVYPSLSPAEQEHQQRQAKLQAASSLATAHEGKNTTESKDGPKTSATNNKSSTRDETKDKKDFDHEDEEKIVAAILKQLTPLIEKRVSDEVRRLQSGEADDDDDDDDDSFMPFPFMFTGGSAPFFATGRSGQPPPPPPPSHVFRQHDNQASEMDFNGLPPGAAFIPPQLLMAMMSDLSRGGPGGEMPGFQQNRPPPHGQVSGEGSTMFADGDPIMGGPPGYFPRRF